MGFKIKFRPKLPHVYNSVSLRLSAVLNLISILVSVNKKHTRKQAHPNNS